MTQQTLQPSSISDLKAASEGAVVELPAFIEGQKFAAKLRRPAMMVLAREGKIPNNLMAQASKLFAGAGLASAAGKPEEMTHMAEVLEVVAKASLVEPTYDQLVSAGIQMTDEQLIFIFNYSQQGVRYLESFRKK